MTTQPRVTFAETFEQLSVSSKVALGRQLCEALDQPGRIPPGLTRTVLVAFVRDVRAASREAKQR